MCFEEGYHHERFTHPKKVWKGGQRKGGVPQRLNFNTQPAEKYLMAHLALDLVLAGGAVELCWHFLQA